MRLFTGIELDDASRAALWREAQALMRLNEGRYSAPENYHLTLIFIGEQTADGLLAAERALRAAAERSAGFSIALERVGTFAKGNRAVLWHGGRANPPILALRSALAEELRAQSVPYADEHGAYRPHITLARQCRVAELPERCEKLLLRCAHITLFESRHNAQGALEYAPLVRAQLTGECR